MANNNITGELILRVGDDMIKIQARDSEKLLRSTNEPRSNPCNNKTIHKERRLQIEELDEWRTQVKEKPGIHDESREIHFMVLNVFPYGTVEVTHSKFDTFKGLKLPKLDKHGLKEIHRCGRSEQRSTQPCDTTVGTTRPGHTDVTQAV
ncbi:hypothetical protein GOBAR_AA24942 [Gossypium barbadense]|uniref:Uncharacterized protein n=1 Tax=Gossypium barbadense TaxID=3634 RepID=A0A2P5WXB9_GOSBA|nr:hypothetical protein GOBAR_AA24942 [Gossypium barbadense]